MAARTHRDRHGRGMRRPLPSKLFHHGTRMEYFNLVVEQTGLPIGELMPGRR